MSSGNEVDRTRPGREGGNLNLTDLAEKIGRSVSAAVVVSALFIALAIYERPGPPRFQAFAVEGKIVRLDTREGTIIACQSGQCVNVRHRGQDLVRELPQPRPAETPAPANADH